MTLTLRSVEQYPGAAAHIATAGADVTLDYSDDALVVWPSEGDPVTFAVATHPCGCPFDVVTSVLRGWREQCSRCGATFDSPDPL